MFRMVTQVMERAGYPMVVWDVGIVPCVHVHELRRMYGHISHPVVIIRSIRIVARSAL